MKIESIIKMLKQIEGYGGIYGKENRNSKFIKWCFRGKLYKS